MYAEQAKRLLETKYTELEEVLRVADGGWNEGNLNRAVEKLAESYFWAKRINGGLTDDHIYHENWIREEMEFLVGL